jgi:hypothetical protein
MEFSGRPQMSSTRQLNNHAPQESNGSFSSMAILMGRTGHKRGDGSDASSQFNKNYKTAISNPIPQEQRPNEYGDQSRLTVDKAAGVRALPSVGEAKPRRNSRGARRGSTRRSSGWNRYWSGGSALNILGFGSKRNTYGSDNTAESDASQYSDHRPSQITQNSAMVPPLKLGGQPEFSRVVSGSPVVETRMPLTREMSGQIERPGSVSTISSWNDDERRDAFSSGIPASVHDHNSWTPVDRHDWATGRTPSNAYTESMYAPTLPRSTIPNFPKDTQFPAPPSAQRPPQRNVSDMSWLNLGGESRV